MMAERDVQWWLIYSIIVAGKSYKFAERAVAKLKAFQRGKQVPFDMIRRLIDHDLLGSALRNTRTGNYRRIEQALRELVRSKIDLASCSPQDLEAIHGIGPKTARFFILTTRPNYRCAALDIHVLRWLGAQGYDVPPQTPTGDRYAELERVFLREADERGMTPRQLDSKIWEKGSGYTVNQTQEQSA